MGNGRGPVENLVTTPSPLFWAGKKVFLTGNTGFKGSWLSIWLQKLGAEVYGYSLPPNTSPSLYSLTNGKSSSKDTFDDLSNTLELNNAIVSAQPEIIIHLAAQSLVRVSYDEPIQTFTTNIMGTANLLEALRAIKSVKSVLIITTDKCYENREWVWPYRENDPLGGHDPYSGSKACTEIITSVYRNSFFKKQGIGVASARAGNVIGGGDWSQDRLIPDCIRSFQKKEKVIIRNPLATRPWQHVLEPLAGYLLLAEALYSRPNNFDDAFNFGPYAESVKPVSWIVDQLSKKWGDQAAWIFDKNSQPHEAQQLALDSSKANSLLGWKPKLSLEQSLEWTIDWYLKTSKHQDPRLLILDQIEKYTALE
jgi:CDP-glucose 4,6-dehydratase